MHGLDLCIFGSLRIAARGRVTVLPPLSLELDVHPGDRSVVVSVMVRMTSSTSGLSLRGLFIIPVRTQSVPGPCHCRWCGRGESVPQSLV